jgi:hypothetical protein
MRIRLKVGLTVAICLFTLTFSKVSCCDDFKSDCGHLKRILDQYAYNLSYKLMSNTHYAAETREKELLEEIKALKLNEHLQADVDSLLGQMKQCQPSRFLSADYGVKGFFTDLNRLMKSDAVLHKRCEGLEPLYNQISNDCRD